MSRMLVVLLVMTWSGLAGAQTPASTPTPQLGALLRLELKPVQKTISVGEFANYTATGIYENGTKNLTQKVDYQTSDSAVAAAPNAEGNKGRVDAIAPGVVTVTASEPITGISTTDTGGVSGTLTVQGALVSLALQPLEKNAAVGDLVTYTATGFLSDGNTKNMTQKVVYASSDTSVAVCPNTDGNKSQVQVVGAGTAVISAVDPITEIATTTEGQSTLTVRVPGATATGRTPTPTPRTTPTRCGDPNGSGDVTVTDGVLILTAAAGLATDCTPGVCDVNGNGAVSVTDGIVVLRIAAGFGDTLDCP